jgi:hypothetical protein
LFVAFVKAAKDKQNRDYQVRKVAEKASGVES